MISAAPSPGECVGRTNARFEAVRRFEHSLAQVIGWVRAHGYRAYEPADGNSSPLFRLTGGRVFPMRVLQQVVLRAPVNIRPLLGVRPHESAIARGYMAAAFLTMYRTRPTAELRSDARSSLEWLIEQRAAGPTEYCWGDPYEYATRSGRRPLGEPLLIWSALIGHAFLDGFEALADERFMAVAASVGRWIQALPAERTNAGRCLSYVAYRQSSIHNSNAVGAGFLARLAAVTGNGRSLDVARDAMLYTCSRQRADGSWFYAEEPKYHWVDNFHTGYILSALRMYRACAGDCSFDDHLIRGAGFFRAAFFEADGRARYFHNSTYPIDIQCAAQAIETLVSLSKDDPSALDEAERVASWTIQNLQAADGHFCYRDLGWTKVTTPMMHWGQATMTKALAVLVAALESKA